MVCRDAATAGWLVSAVCLLAGCAADFDDLRADQSQIIGGFESAGDDHVVAVSVGGLCTGTVVAPRVVLTAAHCVESFVTSGNTQFGQVDFGTGSVGGGFFASRDIVDMVIHRRYDSFTTYDVALLLLDADVPTGVAIAPVNRRAFTDDDVGREVRVVGFGDNENLGDQSCPNPPCGTGSGLKRQISIAIDDVTIHHLIFGGGGRGTCQGDSGGPTFVDFGEGEEVVAVTSFGSGACLGLSSVARTDVYWDDFIGPVLAAWSGPCPADGTCDEACAVADPDCDTCAFQGGCDPSCPIPDLDCPLGSLSGDLCGDPIDCESRHCVAGSDDERITYCSQSCDPDQDGEEQCDLPLTRCEARAGGGVCVYPSVSPGAQGWPCDAADECRSGMCDTGTGICVESCASDDECSGEYSCESRSVGSVCTVPDEAGCGCGQGSALGSLWAVVGLLGAFGRRRKNRHVA